VLPSSPLVNNPDNRPLSPSNNGSCTIELSTESRVTADEESWFDADPLTPPIEDLLEESDVLLGDGWYLREDLGSRASRHYPTRNEETPLYPLQV
jgi:hypothetical protein